jgi:hypothetical protein
LDASYRVLFLLPSSFMIVTAIHGLRAASRGSERGLLAVTAMVLVALGGSSAPPWFGKLRFQYHRWPPERSLEVLDPAAIWLAENRRFDNRCTITSDDVTEWAMSAWLGTRQNVDKVSGVRYVAGYRPWSPQTTEDLIRYHRQDVPNHFPGARGCGFLVAERTRLQLLPTPFSWVGSQSGHWPPAAAHMASRVPGRLPEAAEGLLALGWRRSFVPPFYWFYEPQRND